MTLFGRDKAVNILQQFYQSNSAEFLALYGRRRVGKTYLIRQFFQKQSNCAFFNVTGTKNAPMKEQIKHFTDQLSNTFYNGIQLQPGRNWEEALNQLTHTITNQVAADKSIVLFFDELPWMCTHRSRLLDLIDYYWNQHWSQDKRIKLIICGSSASWIINKVIHHRGGLHNRITYQIHLQPFNLAQMQAFLQGRQINLNPEQLLQIYMVTGGIPFYLTKIQPGLSASQVIDSLAFSQTGFLFDEFDKLFSSLFDNSQDYIKAVRLLAQHRYGLGERQLLDKLGSHMLGGKGRRLLDDLEQTGFIMRFKPLYHKRKGIYYRISDEYILFYLQWIEPLKTTLAQQALQANYWQSVQHTPAWNNWKGYAFEAVCYKHIAVIQKALGLGPTAFPSTWRYVPQKDASKQGAQIDLLFDRPDDAITICEIKYTNQPFKLTKDYIDNLQQKINVFKTKTGTRKQIFIVLISANGLKNNYYADDMISQIVTLHDLLED